MPWVEIHWDPEIFDGEEIKAIISALPSAVATALDAPNDPGGGLSWKDIEVKNYRFDDLDVRSKPLAIIIFAHDFPSRVKNLGERRQMIEDLLKPSVPGDLSGFIWLIMIHGSFGEFEGTKKRE